MGEMSINQALVIGLAQALAVIPGISRSGSTVVSGLFLGLKKEEAFNFSFLLAIPAMIGALVLQLIDTGFSNSIDSKLLMIGLISSGLVGFWALRILGLVIKKSKLAYFGWYTLILGLMVLFVR